VSTLTDPTQKTQPAPERAAATVQILKAGGAVVSDPSFLSALSRYVADQTAAGKRCLIVHGGGDLITEVHRRMGVTNTKHEGLRATPEDSMRLVAMALRGLTNATVVSSLVARGVSARGLSGVDLGLLRSDFLNRHKLGRVGGPPRVDVDALQGLLEAGYTPVLAPICLGPDAGLLNVNADTVAHSVAVALGPSTLDFVSDVPGVLGPGAAVTPRVTPDEARALLESAGVSGGMIPKLQAALAAAQAGVTRVRIGDLTSLAADQATEVTA